METPCAPKDAAQVTGQPSPHCLEPSPGDSFIPAFHFSLGDVSPKMCHTERTAWQQSVDTVEIPNDWGDFLSLQLLFCSFPVSGAAAEPGASQDDEGDVGAYSHS